MLFETLLADLVKLVRDRVNNGDLTERSLAREIGISQPHMHNILKGARHLSVETADKLMQTLQISVLDLVNRDAILRFVELGAGRTEVQSFSFVRCLSGLLGPTHPWPSEMGTLERIPFSASALQKMGYPVLVRLGGDPRMAPIFALGDLALLDQLEAHRTTVDPVAYYALKMGDSGIVRQLRLVGQALYITAQDTLRRPADWERLDLGGAPLQQIVRARVTFVPKKNE